MLADNSDWFTNGTCKVAPHLFDQLHTIHALHEHSVVPLLYVFMQRKRELDYVNALTAIRAASVMCDYEIGFHNAVRQVFGNNVVVVGCLFHLGQCVYRKVIQLGLSDQYQQDDDLRLKCKMLVTLAFIPAVDVIAAFETLAGDIPDGDDLESLFDYFEDTWIGRPARRGGTRRNPTFPINVWSIHDREPPQNK